MNKETKEYRKEFLDTVNATIQGLCSNKHATTTLSVPDIVKYSMSIAEHVHGYTLSDVSL